MTVLNPEIAAALGLQGRPDLPPEVYGIMRDLAERVVSPDVPPPLVDLTKAVARNVTYNPEAPHILGDARATLGHLRLALGEVSVDAPVQSAPAELDEKTRHELEVTLRHAEARKDADAVRVLRFALGITAAAQQPLLQ